LSKWIEFWGWNDKSKRRELEINNKMELILPVHPKTKRQTRNSAPMGIGSQAKIIKNTPGLLLSHEFLRIIHFHSDDSTMKSVFWEKKELSSPIGNPSRASSKLRTSIQSKLGRT
jgi:hypothetical protein